MRFNDLKSAIFDCPGNVPSGMGGLGEWLILDLLDSLFNSPSPVDEGRGGEGRGGEGRGGEGRGGEGREGEGRGGEGRKEKGGEGR